jgi:hypothetical protein
MPVAERQKATVKRLLVKIKHDAESWSEWKRHEYGLPERLGSGPKEIELKFLCCSTCKHLDMVGIPSCGHGNCDTQYDSNVVAIAWIEGTCYYLTPPWCPLQKRQKVTGSPP